MKDMIPDFVRGTSFVGYGVSLAVGVGIPIPILNSEILRYTTVRDRDIYASVVDYSVDYPERTGKVICKLNYEQLKRGEVIILDKKVEVGSLSSYSKALEICHLLKDEIKGGSFLLSKPMKRLTLDQKMKPLEVRDNKR